MSKTAYIIAQSAVEGHITRIALIADTITELLYYRLDQSITILNK